MNQFLSNKIIAGIVALALLVGVGVLVSSGDTSSTTRNAALVVATPCTKPGQVTKVSKQSVVCATTKAGSLWYATMKAKGKAQACKSPGAIREKSNIVWVCGVIKKKKLWQATQPLTALPVEGDLPSTTPATPDAPVNADNAVLAEPAVIDTAATQTLAPAVPAALSLETQPMGGVNAMALETQPVVQLRAKTGAPISIAGITITAVTDRTNVVPSGNTAVTDATGRATFKTLSLMGKMGDIALTFTAQSVALAGITSGNLDLAAGVATALVADTRLGAVAAGQQFNQFFKLHLQDSSGNIVAVSGRDVVVSSSKEGPYGLTTVATASDGYVLFKELMLVQPGKTTLTFTSGLLSTTSIVEVRPGDSQGLKITTEASESASNNVAFAQAPVVQLIDAEGNNVTTEGFNVKAKITGYPAGADNKNTYLANPDAKTNKDGVATFGGLSIQGLIGKYTLGFEPTGGLTQYSAKPTELSAGAATKLFQQRLTVVQPGSTAGTWSLTQSPVFGLRDISNNPVTKSGVTVTATVPGEKQTFSADTDAYGVATFLGMTFSGDSAGDRTIKYTAPEISEVKNETITLLRLNPVVSPTWDLSTEKTTTSDPFQLTAPDSNSDGDWTYTSSEETIATVTRTGKVTQQEVAGTTFIRATQEQTAKFASATKTAILRIARTLNSVTSPLVYPPSYDTTSGSFAPSFKPDSNSDVAWTYTSSNATIATVHPADGTVTPRGVAGTIIITATQAQTAKYTSISDSETLVIYYQAPVYPSDRNVGSVPFDPLTRPASKSTGAWTYTSLNSGIATVNRDSGKVTLTRVAGTVTIRATQEATGDFAKITSEVTVVIPLIPVVVSPAWVLWNRYTDSGAFTTPITSNSDSVWTYTSSNTNIAAVDRATGTITPKIVGTTTITATHAATSRYAAATIISDLRISRTYQVGEAGPGGGTVFYDAGAPQAWGRYLEVAPADIQRKVNFFGQYKYTYYNGCSQWTWPNSISNVTDTGIGTGKANTNKILTCLRAQFGDGPSSAELPAVLANKYSTSTAGAGQWFLPSKDELNQLCKIYSNGRTDTAQFYAGYQNGCTGSTSPTGGFVANYYNDFYWSSTIGNLETLGREYFAWYQDFYNGSQYSYPGGVEAGLVRPVRAF